VQGSLLKWEKLRVVLDFVIVFDEVTLSEKFLGYSVPDYVV